MVGSLASLVGLISGEAADESSTIEECVTVPMIKNVRIFNNFSALFNNEERIHASRLAILVLLVILNAIEIE